MKAFEIMEQLFAKAQPADFSRTCDTLKAGDPAVTVHKLAVAMFATPDVVRQVKQWGAELLIVHEPTYYNHMDEHSDEKLECLKRKLIEESGLTIFRYHDHTHATFPDIIDAGQYQYFGLQGKADYGDGKGSSRFYLETPMTPMELAKVIEERCGIQHLRICGTTDEKCTVISGMFGAPNGVLEELKNEESQIVLVGEAKEWCCAEYARDAAQLGYKKALIYMGHVGSERDGMRYTADLLTQMYPEISVKYFECGEVYQYTDQA